MVLTYANDVKGNVVIPAEYNNKPVTKIADGVFKNKNNLISVVIPDSVYEIGTYAFGICKNLKSVTFGANVKVIGEYAFNQDGRLTNIVLPESVETIGVQAFNKCEKLTEVTLGKNIKEIKGRAFDNCKKLATYNYSGTKQNFIDIKKYSLWSGRNEKATNSKEYVVKCSDGELSWREVWNWIEI